MCQIGKSPILITVGTLNINKVVGKYMLDEFIQVDNAIASASPVVFFLLLDFQKTPSLKWPVTNKGIDWWFTNY